jgi:hypothetical protein
MWFNYTKLVMQDRKNMLISRIESVKIKSKAPVGALLFMGER